VKSIFNCQQTIFYKRIDFLSNIIGCCKTMLLNHNLSQKLKLIGKGKFNHLINTPTLTSTSEAQHVKYLIEMESKLLNQDSNSRPLL
jgi:hypothetical protein